MRTDEPRSIALKDYQPPAHRIAEVSLTFALDPQKTRVRSVMKMTRVADAPLVLNGEQLTLVAIKLDGADVEYVKDDETLTIARTPAARIFSPAIPNNSHAGSRARISRAKSPPCRSPDASPATIMMRLLCAISLRR